MFQEDAIWASASQNGMMFIGFRIAEVFFLELCFAQHYGEWTGRGKKSMNLIHIERMPFIPIVNTVLSVGECCYEHLVCDLWTLNSIIGMKNPISASLKYFTVKKLTTLVWNCLDESEKFQICAVTSMVPH